MRTAARRKRHHSSLQGNPEMTTATPSHTESAHEARKLCIHCQWYVHVDNPEKGMSQHQCNHPALVNPVDGSNANCTDARAAWGDCGPDGLLFSERVGGVANRIRHVVD